VNECVLISDRVK